MSPFPADSALSALLSITLKASVLLGITAAVQAVLYRRTSAATRHLVWTLAVLGLLLLPVLTVALPDWTISIRTTTSTAVEALPAAGRVDPSVDTASPSPPPEFTPTPAAGGPVPLNISWSGAIATVYVTGLIVVLIHLTIQRWHVRRLAREAIEVRSSEWTRLLSECAARLDLHRPVRLLRSRDRAIPMAFGTRRPSILIPAIAETWPDDRRRAVVLHELAHVTRYDCLTQTLALAACAMYWFHPATWWVARRLRIERELACDDRVIAAGTQAREYAGHLLEIAYSFGTHRAPALAVAMTRPGQLERRMLAALDEARNRSVPAFRARLAGAAITAVLLLPLAGATPIIVAAEMDAARATVLADPLPPPPQAPVLAPHLKAVDGPLNAPTRRMIRAAAAALGIAQDYPPGTWEIRPGSTQGTVHLRLVEANSSSGSNIPTERLEGLTAAQLAAGGPVQFRLRRDAGVFTFEGVLRNGVGAGTFSFAPDSNFIAELAKRGFGRPTAREQYQMARHDVGYAFLDELSRQRYEKPEIAELVRAGQHGVDVAYLRDMGALGYQLGSLEPLINLRDHGVTPTYVRELAALGYKALSADDLRRARDHGISPEYVRAMRDAGYASIPMEQLIKARDHGVTAPFVRELAEAGHRGMPLDQVIRVRDHGVSPEYVRDMRQLGYPVPLEELVRARDHGVTVEFVRDMAAIGHTSLPMDALIRLRDHGVTPAYARELKALGYDRLGVDDLVTLRDHGLTADRIRAANTRAGTRLPIDQLKALAAGGMR